MRQISPGRLLDRLPFRRWKTPWQRSPASLANTAIPRSLVSPMTFLLLTSSINEHHGRRRQHAVNDGAPVKCLDRVESREIEADPNENREG